MIISKKYLNKNFLIFTNKLIFIGLELSFLKNCNIFVKIFFKKNLNVIFYKNNHFLLVLFFKFSNYFNYLSFVFFLINCDSFFNFYINIYLNITNYFNKNNFKILDFFCIISFLIHYKLLLIRYKYLYNIKSFSNLYFKKNFITFSLFKIKKNNQLKYKYIFYLCRLNNLKFNLIKYLYFLFGNNIYIYIKYNIYNIIFYKNLIFNYSYYILNLFKKYFLMKNSYFVNKNFYYFNKNFKVISYLKLKSIINLNLLNLLNLFNLVNLNFILYKNNIFIYSTYNSDIEILNTLIKYKNLKKYCILKTNLLFKFSDIINYNKIKNFIFEVQNNILISEKDNFFFTNNKIPLKLLNPISNYFSIVRSTLFPCLIKNLIYNLKYNINKLRLIEIGKIFLYDFKVKNINFKIKLIKEKYVLSLLFYNYTNLNNIFFYINFYFYPLKFKTKPTKFNLKLYCKSNNLIIINDRTVGNFCCSNNKLINNYNLKRNILLLELDFFNFNILNFNYYIKVFFIKRNLNLVFTKNINFILIKFILKKFFYKNNILNYYYDLILINNFNNKLFLKLIFFNIKIKLLDFLVLKFLYYLNNINFIVL